ALTGSVPRDGSAAMTGPLVLPGDPTTNLQAAPKQYVDNAVSSLASGAFKAPVKAATVANITLSGTQTIDGIALVADDRCLVKNQSTGSQNGIYLVKVGAWVRATDFDAWSEIFGTSVIVDQGTTQADTVWICTANAGGTLGTTAITFAQMQGQIADGTLALARLVNAGGASRLIGRGSAGGAGAWQEITLGAGLSMAAQVLSATASGIIDYQAFTSVGAGTWTKPAGATANDLVLIMAWGAGAGGGSLTGNGFGGGGGACSFLFTTAGRLSATESVSVGTGGTGAALGVQSGNAGGNSTFGSFVTALGGGPGQTGGSSSTQAAAFGGGTGASSSAASTFSLFGGGGGGAAAASNTAGSFSSSLGSGGGTGNNSGAGAVGGVACGGGGSNSSNVGGAGGRGEIRVWTLKVG
ncbi:MAG: hypothetical protein ACK515_10775, partial [bacterium]